MDSTDLDASYFFEGGQLGPGQCGGCKITLSPYLIECSRGRFPKGKQFGIRQGSTIVGVGTIIASKVKKT